MRVFVFLVLALGFYLSAETIRNIYSYLWYGPNLRAVLLMITILIIMPVLVLLSTTEKFVAKWWDRKGQRILLIIYLLIALGYAFNFYWALIVAAT